MLFDFNQEKLKEIKAFHTVNEIKQQPATWKKTVRIIEEHKQELDTFMTDFMSHPKHRIIFSGAGTSEFVGNSLIDVLRRRYDFMIDSVATTLIVSNPDLYLEKDTPTLLISFGRSGNSPESIGAVNHAEAIVDDLYHLVVTCNANGQLAQFKSDKSKIFAINLPEETHDQSFAMTSSYSNMVLAAYLALTLDKFEENKQLVNELVRLADNYFAKEVQTVNEIVSTFDFERIVYLGSNNYKGFAQESALKMLELTTGEVASLFDSSLGFRHGPKSFLNDNTLVVLYTSQSEYTFRYDKDLFDEISGNKLAKVLVVTTEQHKDHFKDADYVIAHDTLVGDDLLGLVYVLVAQSFSVLKSLQLNKTPDNPFPSGIVNRVVQGVTLYDYEGESK